MVQKFKLDLLGNSTQYLYLNYKAMLLIELILLSILPSIHIVMLCSIVLSFRVSIIIHKTVNANSSTTTTHPKIKQLLATRHNKYISGPKRLVNANKEQSFTRVITISAIDSILK